MLQNRNQIPLEVRVMWFRNIDKNVKIENLTSSRLNRFAFEFLLEPLGHLLRSRASAIANKGNYRQRYPRLFSLSLAFLLQFSSLDKVFEPGLCNKPRISHSPSSLVRVVVCD